MLPLARRNWRGPRTLMRPAVALLAIMVSLFAPSVGAAQEDEPDPLFGAEPYEIVEVGGLAYAVGQSVEHGPTLFVTDGTPAGTRTLGAVPCKGWESGGRRLGVIGDRPVLICQTPWPELWTVQTDGRLAPLHREFTQSREYLSLYFAGGRAIAMSGSRSGGPRQLHLLEPDAVVLADVPIVGFGDLFGALPDGSLIATTTTTQPYHDITELRRFYPDGRTAVFGRLANSSAERNVTVAGGRVYFFGVDREHGTEPWVSDGTAEGTHLAVDATPGEASSPSSGRILVAPDGTWYVETEWGRTSPVDGALGPVVRISASGDAAIVSGPEDGAGGRMKVHRIEGLVDGRVVFSSGNWATGGRAGLFSARLEAVDAELIRSSRPLAGNASFDDDDSWQRRIQFSRGVIGVTFGERLEFSDGTPGGTRLIGQLPGTWYRSDRTTSPIVDPVEVGGRLVFGALSPDTRRLELWATNADATGIEPLTRSGQFGTVEPSVSLAIRALGGRRYRLTGTLDFGRYAADLRRLCRGSITAFLYRRPVGFSTGSVVRARSKARVRLKGGACRFATSVARPARRPGTKRREHFISVASSGAGHALKGFSAEQFIGRH